MFDGHIAPHAALGETDGTGGGAPRGVAGELGGGRVRVSTGSDVGVGGLGAEGVVLGEDVALDGVAAVAHFSVT